MNYSIPNPENLPLFINDEGWIYLFNVKKGKLYYKCDYQIDCVTVYSIRNVKYNSHDLLRLLKYDNFENRIEPGPLHECLIQRIVYEYYGLSQDRLFDKRRRGILIEARMIYCFLVINALMVHPLQVSKFINKDRSTVYYYLRTVFYAYHLNANFRNKMNQICRVLNLQPDQVFQKWYIDSRKELPFKGKCDLI